jgi:hypothetical protein
MRARPHLPRRLRASAARDPLPQERRLTDAAPGGSRALADVVGRGGTGRMGRMGPIGRIGLDQAKSNQIKPNQTSGSGCWESAAAAKMSASCTCTATYAVFAFYCGYFSRFSRIKPDQGGSNQIKPPGGQSSKFKVQGSKPNPVQPGEFGDYDYDGRKRAAECGPVTGQLMTQVKA